MSDLRKIDALIAEHVYGWTPADARDAMTGFHTRQGILTLPAYSTDIALAFGVLEKLRREKDWWFTLYCQEINAIKITTDEKSILTDYQPEMPWAEAICRHVLHVLGVSYE